MQADGVDEAVELALRDARLCRQFELIDLVHETAENAALTAASGDHPASRFFVQVIDAVTRFNGCRAHIPVDRDRLKLTGVTDQTLVAQITQYQQLRVCAQGHQRDKLTLVYIHRQRALSRDRHAQTLAMLVEHLDFTGQRGRGTGQGRQMVCVVHSRGRHGHSARLHQKNRPLSGPAFKECGAAVRTSWQAQVQQVQRQVPQPAPWQPVHRQQQVLLQAQPPRPVCKQKDRGQRKVALRWPCQLCRTWPF